MRDEAGSRLRDDDLEFVDEHLAKLKAGHDDENRFGFRVGVTELENNVLIPRYYDRAYLSKLEEYAAENDCHLVSINDLIEAGVVGAYRGHGGVKKQWYDARRAGALHPHLEHRAGSRSSTAQTMSAASRRRSTRNSLARAPASR